MEQLMYHINNTRMLAGARDTLLLEKKPRRVGIELLIFLLVATIASSAQAIITYICTLIMTFTDRGLIEMLKDESITYEALLEHLNEIMANIPSWMYAAMLAGSGFMIVTAILYCRWIEKRKAYTVGFTKRSAVSEYLLGILIGFVMILAPVVACHLSGCITITLSDNFNPVMVIVFFFCFVLQGMGEEALFRGYLMTTLARRTKIWGAIIISSLMFSLFHGGNANFNIIAFINIFLFGIFASVFMLKRGSIWAVGAIHTVWNFTQGNIFGFSVSGNPKFDSVFECTSTNFGWVLHGGEFGLEGGLGVTVVLMIAILGALLMPTKKSEYVEVKTDADIEIN